MPSASSNTKFSRSLPSTGLNMPRRRKRGPPSRPFGRDVQPPGLDAGQVEQVIDHVGEFLGRGLYEAHLHLLLGRERAVHPVQQHRVMLRMADGRAELVAHVGRKRLLSAVACLSCSACWSSSA